MARGAADGTCQKTLLALSYQETTNDSRFWTPPPQKSKMPKSNDFFFQAAAPLGTKFRVVR
jgi:hypothetical protein